MHAPAPARRSLTILAIPLLAACTLAPPQSAEFEPLLGLAGKDVSWHPTPPEMVESMLDLAHVAPNDYVIDLGSGDGRIAIAAAKRGARAQGIEYNPELVALSQRNAAKEGVADRAHFVQADVFESDLRGATVITAFLLTDLNLRLEPKLLALRPGTRIVSYVFKMGDWIPDETVTLGCGAFCTAYLWIVPARAEGTWRVPRGELVLAQEFQNVFGTLTIDGVETHIKNGRLRGEQFSFTAGDARYRGRVGADAIEGSVSSGGIDREWRAVRVGGAP